MNVIKAKKQQMSRFFLQTGNVVPVTIVVSETELDAEMENKEVIVVGKSKGKGWTGVMKRWGFHGGPATRGQSTKPRSAGSVGSQTPGKVRKGKKMAGRKGNYQVTIKGLKIVKVVPQDKTLFISGPVPGARNAKLTIKVL